MSRWNELPEDAKLWAVLHSSKRMRISKMEFGVRVKGVRGKRPAAPGQVAFVAGQGDFGFNGRRYSSQNSSSIVTVEHEDGPYNKHGKKVFAFRRKSSGGIATKMTRREDFGIDPIKEKDKKDLAKNCRKGPRRRTKKKLTKQLEKNRLDKAMNELLAIYSDEMERIRKS